jgi:hypothetical protein
VRWEKVWHNIQHPVLFDSMKATWYMVVHEIIPTNERLAAKRITNTERCVRCAKLDSLPHHITECQEEGGVWNWSKGKIAQILRMDPRHIPADWALRPTLRFWPPQRHAAIIWILALFVSYKLSWHSRHTLLDYTAYLRRARFKRLRWAPFHITGKYLDLL